jgi:hypothetical protein
MTVSRVALIAVVALLAAPAAALGGGFATVSLSSLPNGTAPGEPWVVDLTVLAHGRSEAPVDGLEPAVVVMRADGGERRRFPAEPTGEPGTYRARVVFDSAGVWRYSVEDGYAGWTHKYPPVRIGRSAEEEPALAATAVASGGGSHGGPDLLLALVVGLGAGLTAGAATRLLQRPAKGARVAEA